MILYFNDGNECNSLADEIYKITMSTNKEPTSLFLDWIPTKKGTNQENAGKLLKQAELLEKFSKTLPIVIFDRYRSITKEEYNWLRKFKTTFFEPSISPRDGFKYLPNWIKIKTLDDITLNTEKRKINIGYIGPLTGKSKSVNKYYLNIETFEKVDIEIYSKDIPTGNEYDELRTLNSSIGFTFQDVQFTVILGTINDYIVGNLDQYYFKALENNCIPFVPIENRYYSALPTVDTSKWYQPYVNMYDKIHVGMINDIYERIKKYYPEMDITYTAEVIKKYLGEK